VTAIEGERVRRPAKPYRMVMLMGGAGTTHFTNPDFYDAIVPRWLPGAPRLWVQASGVAELACAALLVPKRTRRLGGWLTVGTLLTVWIANIQAVIDGGMRDADPPFDSAAAAWIRLPLQLPMIYDAARIARSA
jgi:uncharacterized membrane protein